MGRNTNFNPRSREGSDSTSCNKTPTASISIHAPAKGATLNIPQATYSNKISIHAPAKGATSVSLRFFNLFTISIHAPAKGATYAHSIFCCVSGISIHAPAKGATAIFHKIINLYCETSTDTTRINSLNINKNYISRIKASILNYFRVRITL